MSEFRAITTEELSEEFLRGFEAAVALGTECADEPLAILGSLRMRLLEMLAQPE